MKTTLGIERIHALVCRNFPALQRETNAISTSYFLGSGRRGNRIIRFKPAPNGLLDFKLVQTEVSEGVRSLERVDSEDTLSAFIESEIAALDPGLSTPRGRFPATARPSRMERVTRQVTSQLAPFNHDVDLNNVLDAYLLYLWEIRNKDGVLLGKYLGKAIGHKRPLTH